jgi:uncharacterized membrane protein
VYNSGAARIVRLHLLVAKGGFVNILVVVLRIIHIVAGVFWVGSSLFTGIFLGPAVSATAEAGQRVLAQLTTKARITAAISASAGLTALAGGWLYWLDSAGLTSEWMHKGPGVGFGIGALFAVVGLVFGSMVGRDMGALGKLATEISGKPTPEQLGKIGAVRRQLAYAGPTTTVTLLIALICMATARYWVL